MQPIIPDQMQPEHKLQAQCVLWFSQTFPLRRGELFATFSEQGAEVASHKLSMGLVKALPDLLQSSEQRLNAIELKAKGSRHNVEHLRSQAKWMLRFSSVGWFCDSLEMFQNIIVNHGAGIHPLAVLNALSGVTSKTVDWDKLTERL